MLSVLDIDTGGVQDRHLTHGETMDTTIIIEATTSTGKKCEMRPCAGMWQVRLTDADEIALMGTEWIATPLRVVGFIDTASIERARQFAAESMR